MTIVSGQFFPKEGGAERQLREVSQLLSLWGWKVSVVTGGCRWDSPHGSLPHGVEIRRIRPLDRRSIRATQGLELLLRSQLPLVRARPDAIIASLVSAASYGALLHHRLARVPLILRLGGATRTSGPRLRAFALRDLVMRSDFVVAPANHLLDQVRHLDELHPHKFVVIPNGVAPCPGRRPTRQARQTHGAPTALYYTNGGPEKNEQAFLDLVRRNRRVRFTVVGHTSRLPVEDNLVNLGWVADPSAVMAQNDVVINTSFSEGSPNFCLQSLAAGVPVLGFDIEALAELRTTFSSGVRTVPEGDLVRFSEVLNKTNWPELLVAGQPTTIEEAAGRWARLLEQVASDDA